MPEVQLASGEVVKFSRRIWFQHVLISVGIPGPVAFNSCFSFARKN